MFICAHHVRHHVCLGVCLFDKLGVQFNTTVYLVAAVQPQIGWFCIRGRPKLAVNTQGFIELSGSQEARYM